jgi:lipopolysaccharide transport system permease protein
VLAALGQPVRFEGLVLALPLWLVMGVAVAGVSLLLAALQVFIRDVEHILMPVLMILMYLTPILYPLTLVPQSVRPWVAANPFAWLVGRMRDALLEGRLAPRWDDALAVAVAALLFAAGRAVFRRLSPHFEDFV